MQITNNLDAMVSQQMQMNKLAQNIAESANIIGDPELKTVTQDLLNAITEQIPVEVGYNANAQAVKVLNETQESLLHIKV